jgi:HK97 gp10 family phage protein
MAKFKIEGMKELQRSIKKLGDVPQKAVTPSSRKGMQIALKSARANAPVDTGELKDGIKLIGEKSRNKGKKVYQIVFDRAKNDIFQKKNKEGKVTGYYPASQEYGFFTRNGRYIPGYHFLEKSLTDNVTKIQQTIVKEMSKRIDKALKG